MSYLNWPVSQIAVQIPGASALFFNNKINFCCHGDIPLSEALAQKQIPEESFIAQLEALSQQNQQQVDYQALDNRELIEHILTRYHEVHRQQLPELIRLAQRVETVHAEHPLCPKGLAAHLQRMQDELADHMHKEEAILFPMLAAGAPPMVSRPISVMMADHEQHRAEIETIYRLTHDVTVHPDACNTWRALYLGLQQFISDLNTHIHIENDVLFARAMQK
jgi:regulator of cell morphogenesis and NO signaling